MTDTSVSSGATSQPSPAYRWLVLVVISVAMFGNYYVYDSIAPIADLLKSELGFTDANYGMLFSVYSAAAIIVLLIAFGMGAFALLQTPREEEPQIVVPMVDIFVGLPGASPEEVERQITIPVEEEFDGMAEIDVMTSTSHEGMASVVIKLKSGTDVDQYMRDAQTALDQITDLPEEAEEPEVIEIINRNPAITVAVYGNAPERRLRRLAEQIRDASIRVYGHAVKHAAKRGIIIADTKFEFGTDEQGRLYIIDEMLTPDSSRFWPVDGYAVGISPPSFDKQFVRDYLETLDWNKTAPGPDLPGEIIRKTAEKYAEAEQRLTGHGKA